MLDVKKGERYNRLVVIKENEKINGKRYFLFMCDCGNTTNVALNSVRRGNTKSCGCLQKEALIKENKKRIKHNMSRSLLYKTWVAIKRRCYNKDSHNYKSYGGRGIKVCDRWKDSFENFYLDMGEKTTPRHSIDRINVNGNYEPSNCRWATIKEQANNKQNSRIKL